MLAVRSFLFAVSAIALAAGPVLGAILTVQPDQVTWDGLVDEKTVTFEDYTGSLGFSFSNGRLIYDASNGTYSTDLSWNATTLNASQARFSTSNFGSDQYRVASNLLPAPSNTSRFYMGGSSSNDPTRIDFGPGVRAFSMDLYTWNNSGLNVTVEVFDTNGASLGTVGPATTSSTQLAFFGITSDTEFGSILLSGNIGGTLMIDKLSFGSLTAVSDPPPNTDTPESATLGYVGLGIIAVIMGAKRRLKS